MKTTKPRLVACTKTAPVSTGVHALTPRRDASIAAMTVALGTLLVSLCSFTRCSHFDVIGIPPCLATFIENSPRIWMRELQVKQAIGVAVVL